MEGLLVNTIPEPILARILVQFHSVPPGENVNFVEIISTGLREYGATSDVNAFLNYCSNLIRGNVTWPWAYYEINNELDWNLSNEKKPNGIVGMRFLLASETARQNVDLIRYGRNQLLDPKCHVVCQDRVFTVDEILGSTLDYFKEEKTGIDTGLECLIELRLEQYSRDKFKYQQECDIFDNTSYQLMGVLMARYDSTANNASQSWCLYSRDYVESDGNMWRIILDEKSSQIRSEQALADIRGIQYDTFLPTDFSRAFRPIYLFYINEVKLAPVPVEEHITLEDYSFDEEYQYLDEQPTYQTTVDQDQVCMHCGTTDSDDTNDMFVCDYCNRGVHQLCENPPIQEFEKQVDPWYCRACCALQNIPIPNVSETLLSLLQSPVLKRKREEDDDEEKEDTMR